MCCFLQSSRVVWITESCKAAPLGFGRNNRGWGGGNLGRFDLICKGCSVLSAFSAAPPDIQFHLQRLDVLEFVGVPLFDLLILPRREEQMRLGDELEEHDAAERRDRGDVSPGKKQNPKLKSSIKGKKWRGKHAR